MTTKRIYQGYRPNRGNPPPARYRDRCEAKVIVIGEHVVNWRKERYGDNEDWDRCTRPATVVIDDRCFCTRHGGELALSKLLGEKDPFQ